MRKNVAMAADDNDELRREAMDWFISENVDVCDHEQPLDWVTTSDWARLICKRADFVAVAPLKKFDDEAWVVLLSGQPQFADRCTKWNRFRCNLWVRLLAVQPQFGSRCERWDELSVADWICLLSRQPQFADKCACWNVFTGKDWGELLSAQPQFADRCDRWDEFSGEQLKLLSRKGII